MDWASDIELLPLMLTAAGTVLLVSEALMPGAYLVVLGVATLGAGVSGLLWPVLAQPLYMGLITAGIGVISFFVYRRLAFVSGPSEQTRAADSLMGEVGEVTEQVDSRSGEVRLEVGFDPNFTARSFDGETIPEGTEVIVVDPGGGNVVQVISVKRLDSARSARDIKNNKELVMDELYNLRA